MTEDKIDIATIVQLAATAGARAARLYNEEENRVKKDRKLYNTRLLLKNFRRLNKHINNSTFRQSQIKSIEDDDMIELQMYDPHNKSEAIAESIKMTTAKTEVIVAHIIKMIKVYKEECNHSKKSKRKFDAFYNRYISDKRIRYEDIAEKYNVDVRTIQSDVKEAVEDFSSLLFGIDFLNNL